MFAKSGKGETVAAQARTQKEWAGVLLGPPSNISWSALPTWWRYSLFPKSAIKEDVSSGHLGSSALPIKPIALPWFGQWLKSEALRGALRDWKAARPVAKKQKVLSRGAHKKFLTLQLLILFTAKGFPPNEIYRQLGEGWREKERKRGREERKEKSQAWQTMVHNCLMEDPIHMVMIELVSRGRPFCSWCSWWSLFNSPLGMSIKNLGQLDFFHWQN